MPMEPGHQRVPCLSSKTCGNSRADSGHARENVPLRWIVLQAGVAHSGSLLPAAHQNYLSINLLEDDGAVFGTVRHAPIDLGDGTGHSGHLEGHQ